jgi:hypothetical protein
MRRSSSELSPALGKPTRPTSATSVISKASATSAHMQREHGVKAQGPPPRTQGGHGAPPRAPREDSGPSGNARNASLATRWKRRRTKAYAFVAARARLTTLYARLGAALGRVSALLWSE